MSKKTELKHFPRNVHGYEHHLKDIYQKCCLLDKKIYKPFDVVVKEVKQFINDYKCEDLMRKKALSTIDMILKDKTKKNNYDGTNQIKVEILLPQIWSIVQSYEESGKIIFIEQLADIMKGKCAQGRIIRLVQFYIVHNS